jgi:uncharacterized protein Veg
MKTILSSVNWQNRYPSVFIIAWIVDGKLKSGVKFIAAALPGTNAPPKVDYN